MDHVRPCGRLQGDVVVVMAKAPAVGRVKTRLAVEIGAERACELYRAFLLDLGLRLRARREQLVWVVDRDGGDFGGILDPGDRCIEQEGGGLGERMWRCAMRVFGAGAARVAIIGADAPHLATASIDAAFGCLADHDVAVIPVRDGGYCLVALRDPHDLFSMIPMGTERVLSETRSRCGALGLRLAVLPETFDVDHAGDVRELAALLESGQVDLPHTATVVSALEHSEADRRK